MAEETYGKPQPEISSAGDEAVRIRRRLVHILHTGGFLLLLATGLMLFSPTLRGLLTGGYSLTFRWIHRWGGVAFALFPLPLLAGAHGRAVLKVDKGQGLYGWRKAHTGSSVAAAAVFLATGLVMWFKSSFPIAAVDWCDSLHLWLTYGSCAILATHLFLAVFLPRIRQLTPEGGRAAS